MKEFIFNDIYELASIIDGSVKYDESFWNYNEHLFIKLASNFSKFTLLHLYIVTRALNYYHRYFRKNGDDLEEDDIKEWNLMFTSYKVDVGRCDLSVEDGVLKWFEDNEDAFEELFSRRADEAVHILFYNRNFLLRFNELTAETIKETKFPNSLITKKGRLKRINIPEWVKRAVFHRDKGRCVYCNTDLTNLYNTLIEKNYDHIVPLDLYGTNDPCNIQLTCESCNKSKSSRKASTSFCYQPWWPEE